MFLICNLKQNILAVVLVVSSVCSIISVSSARLRAGRGVQDVQRVAQRSVVHLAGQDDLNITLRRRIYL